jgi:hypothetical protein
MFALGETAVGAVLVLVLPWVVALLAGSVTRQWRRDEQDEPLPH